MRRKKRAVFLTGAAIPIYSFGKMLDKLPKPGRIITLIAFPVVLGFFFP
jgi:hypothetical protein